MATATESNVLEAQPRVAGTKNDARRYRVGGKAKRIIVLVETTPGAGSPPGT